MSDLLDDNPRANFGGDEINRADFGNRLAAYILDLVFLSAFAMFISFSVGMIGLSQIDDNGGSTSFDEAASGIVAWFIGLFWALTIGAILYALIEAFTGASLGKMALGLKIGTQDAQTASTGTYVLRAVVKNFQYVPLSLMVYNFNELLITINNLYSLAFFVSCLFALGADRLALHDKLLGTAVYKKTDLDK